MAQRKTQIKILKSKLILVTSQKDELHSILDVYVDKVIAMGKAVTDADEKEMKSLEEMNSLLETCLEVLAQKYVEIEDMTSGSEFLTSDSQLSHSASSSSLSRLPLSTAPQTSSAPADFTDISRLYNRMEAIEMAMTTCHSEVHKCTEMQRGTRDDIENLTQKLDNLQIKTAEAETRQISRCDQMEKRVKELEVSDGYQGERLDRIEDQLKQLETNHTDTKKYQDTRLCNIEDNVKQIEMKTVVRLEKMDTKVMTAVEQKLEDRLAVVELNRRKDLRHYSKKLNEVDSLYKQVCLIVDCKVTPLQRLLRILNNLHMKAVKRDEMTEQKGKATVLVSNTLAQAVAPQTLEKLLFHPRCGQNIKLVNNNRTARRNEDYGGYAIVMTDRTLQDNEVFEVQLDKLNSMFNWSLKIGVTTHQPSELYFPDSMLSIKSNIWMMCWNKVCCNGSFLVSNYRQNLDSLKVGDRVGVVRKPDGTIHFIVNGTDQGACATNVPPNVYGIFDLGDKAAQVSIVDK